MLGDFITRLLVIIVAMVTVFERIGEVLVSWLPMYGEMKLAFLIYLWYPKTKGTHYVYETLLRPYFSKHEPEIDRKLLEYRARARDIALLYFQNFASQGQLKFYEFLQFLAKQSSRNWTSRNGDDQQQQQRGSPKQNSPTPPPSPSLKRSIQHPTVKADIVCQTLNETTGTVVEHSISPQRTATAADESGLEGTLRAARKLPSPLTSCFPRKGEKPKEEIEGAPEKGEDLGFKEAEAAADGNPAEEVSAGGVGGVRHGLEVSPRRLLDEPVADGDLAAAEAGLVAEGGGGGGSGWGLDAGGRKGEEILEADVGGRRGAEGRELEIDPGD
ncbi:hypothetical protein MRB53_034402 [Persea americana]|uniref:Uncharacterized protein n=1 Tax=Persea americana TaxID=3435 RepID=A0ACC2K1Q6_PERAE|nr:hypothetical protein MRB53_034402 [Persea americana]